jgi:hypothetical protein
MTTSFPRSILVAAAAGLITVGAPVATASAGSITVKGKQKSHGAVWATYTSSKGSFKATAVERHKLKVTGRIQGKKLRGTVRTRQVGGGKFGAKGSGRLGGRKVRISGGGPNNLKTVRLVLRW